MRPLHVGCSGWDYDAWSRIVYEPGLPRSRRLEAYARRFSTVEVNSSFYRLPAVTTVEAWCNSVPEDFKFAFKASRYLTHVKRLKGIGHGIRRLVGRLKPAREDGKLGPVLWQLPPDFRRDRERLDRVKRLLELLPDGRHAIELRHPSWFTDDVVDLLASADVALVIAHDGRREELCEPELTARWAYVRLHYGAAGRRGNYSRAELARWRRRLDAWRAQAETFAYLNNDWEGFAPRNAEFLAGDDNTAR